VINVGGTETMTMLELAELVQTMLGIPQPLRARFVPYEALPGRYQDVRHRVPDTTKAKKLLDFAAGISVDEGLERTIAWHQQQRSTQAAEG
jgi:UDP-glucose 4-epimerase